LHVHLLQRRGVGKEVVGTTGWGGGFSGWGQEVVRARGKGNGRKKPWLYGKEIQKRDKMTVNRKMRTGLRRRTA